MSKRRSVSALAASLGVLAAACWLVTLAFPLAAEPQMVADGPGVTVDLGNAAIMHRTSIIYPPAARVAKVEGTVLVEATTDSSGNVVDARILSGPNELRRGVLQSVLQWHFTNDTGGNTRQVRVTFTKPPESETPKQVTIRTANGETRTVTVPPGAPIEGVIGGVVGGVPGGVTGGMVSSVLTPNWVGKPLKDVMIYGLSDEAKSRLMQRLPVHSGDILAADSLERTSQAIRDYDEHMNVVTSRDRDGNVSFMITAPGASAPNAAYGMAEPPPPANGAKRITIGGNVQSAKLVSQEKPVYPPLAKQARISGVVKLQAIIATDGSIRNLQVISGHPLLVPAALDAVRTWVYQKTLLNGDPVEVMTQIDVNFTLSDGPPPPQQ